MPFSIMGQNMGQRPNPENPHWEIPISHPQNEEKVQKPTGFWTNFGCGGRTRWLTLRSKVIWLQPVFELVAAKCHRHLALKWVRVLSRVKNKHHPMGGVCLWYGCSYRTFQKSGISLDVFQFQSSEFRAFLASHSLSKRRLLSGSRLFV